MRNDEKISHNLIGREETKTIGCDMDKVNDTIEKYKKEGWDDGEYWMELKFVRIRN